MISTSYHYDYYWQYTMPSVSMVRKLKKKIIVNVPLANLFCAVLLAISNQETIFQVNETQQVKNTKTENAGE